MFCQQKSVTNYLCLSLKGEFLNTLGGWVSGVGKGQLLRGGFESEGGGKVGGWGVVRICKMGFVGFKPLSSSMAHRHQRKDHYHEHMTHCCVSAVDQLFKKSRRGH